MVATLIDFSYLRAITRERNRPIEREREAYERYVRRQTTFYVYLILHEEEACRSHARADAGRPRGRLDLRSWRFVMRSSEDREREAEEIESRPNQLAPTGGCLIQGYVHFDHSIHPRSRWIEINAEYEAEDEDHLRAELRWELEPWTPPRRRRSRPRRPPRDERPERERDRDGDRGDS